VGPAGMGDFDPLLQQRRATVCERGQCHVVGVRRQLNKDLQYTELVNSGKSGPKDQVALHYYYTSPSHWCTTHEVSKL